MSSVVSGHKLGTTWDVNQTSGTKRLTIGAAREVWISKKWILGCYWSHRNILCLPFVNCPYSRLKNTSDGKSWKIEIWAQWACAMIIVVRSPHYSQPVQQPWQAMGSVRYSQVWPVRSVTWSKIPTSQVTNTLLSPARHAFIELQKPYGPIVGQPGNVDGPGRDRDYCEWQNNIYNFSLNQFSLYENSYLAPKLGEVKQQKYIIQCWASRTASWACISKRRCL